MSKNSDGHFFKAPRYLLRKQNILRLLKQHPEIKTFLDVGCGAGELACSLAERGLHGVGVDFSDEAIKYSEKIRKTRGIPEKNLKFLAGGLERVKGQTFDLVICCEVLEHVKEDQTILRDLLKHTNKYALISVPAKQKLFDASDEAVGHFRRYEKNDLHELLKSADLDVLHFANYGYPYTDLVRVARKSSFKKKLKQSAGASMKSKSKQSGINPVKLPRWLQTFDIESFIKILFLTSLPFNRFNLSDSYLALCKRTDS